MKMSGNQAVFLVPGGIRIKNVIIQFLLACRTKLASFDEIAFTIPLNKKSFWFYLDYKTMN
jgi:hypothetical protein